MPIFHLQRRPCPRWWQHPARPPRRLYRVWIWSDQPPDSNRLKIIPRSLSCHLTSRGDWLESLERNNSKQLPHHWRQRSQRSNKSSWKISTPKSRQRERSWISSRQLLRLHKACKGNNRRIFKALKKIHISPHRRLSEVSMLAMLPKWWQQAVNLPSSNNNHRAVARTISTTCSRWSVVRGLTTV